MLTVNIGRMMHLSCILFGGCEFTSAHRGYHVHYLTEDVPDMLGSIIAGGGRTRCIQV